MAWKRSMLQLSPLSPGCRACRSTRNGSGPRTPPSWRCWRSSPPCRCPPRCCSHSSPSSNHATTPSAPPQRCTQARSTSPWLWSRIAPEVPHSRRGQWRQARGGEQGKSVCTWAMPQGLWQRDGVLKPFCLLQRQDSFNPCHCWPTLWRTAIHQCIIEVPGLGQVPATVAPSST